VTFLRETDHPWFQGHEFVDVRAPELLERLRPLPTEGKPAAWVLDLDSTLFCVGPRVRASFDRFLREHPKAPLEWHRVLPFLTAQTLRYSLERSFREILERWNSREEAAVKAKELWEAFHEPWKTAFFSNRFLYLDEPYPGAREFLASLRESGRELVYLTGRDAPRTKAGTLEALRLSGFPWDAGCHLFMKPDGETSDLDYKRRAISVLRQRFGVEALLDNEPENLVMFAKEVPEAEIVFFHSIMSPRMPTGELRRYLQDRKLWRLVSYV